MSKYIIAVERDDDPMDPREDDNMGTMVCLHKRYTLGDKHDYVDNAYDNWGELKRDIVREHDPAVILPLFLYDHSGITISASPFSCPWDSGQVGFIFISKKRVRFEYNVKRVSPKVLDLAENVLRAEVKTYDCYLTGDIWGYAVSDKLGNEHESCWGFFGEEDCRQEAERVVAGLEQQDKDSALALLKAQAAMPCCLP